MAGRISRLIVGVAAASFLVIAPQTAGAIVLHDQLAATTPGSNVNSQNFEASLDSFDDLGADDFVVPDGMVWRINKVEVSGESLGNQATTANLFLFASAGTLPGAQIISRPDIPRGSGAVYPNLELSLSDLPVLPPGRYWVGVQANLNFTGGNDWWWSDHGPQVGEPAAWRQPGDGFGDGCTSFVRRSTCPSYPGSGATPDQAFRLSGDSAGSSLEVLMAKAKRHGKVKLTVNAPNVGDLVAMSSKLKAVDEPVTTIGPVSFVMKPKARTRRKLKDGKRVRAKIAFTLPGLNGEALAAKLKVRLKP